MKFAFDPRHFIAIFVVAGCVSAILAGAAHLRSAALDDQALVDESLGVQRHLRDTEAAIVDMETSQRGYLLTLELSDLDAYRHAALQEDTEVAGLMKASREGTWDARLASLRNLSQEKRAEMDRTIDRARAGDVDGAQAVVRTGAGKVAMGRLRHLLANMIAEESGTLIARRAGVTSNIHRSLQGAAVLGALAASLLVGLFLLVRRQRVTQIAKARRVTDQVNALVRQGRADKVELERASRELHLSQAHLAGIIDTASAAILTVDSDQKIVIANQAAAQVFGIARDELIGSCLERWVPQRFRENQARDLRHFSASKGGVRRMGAQRDVMALRANGEEFPIDAGISHLHSGEHEWFTVVLQDITERRRSEAALLATTWKLEAALSSMNDAVFIADADGSPRDLNHAFATFHRFPNRDECLRAFVQQPDLLELTLADGELVPPDQWVVPRALRGETASNVEFRVRRKDSGETWIGSYNFAPIRAVDGAVVGAVAIGRDITEFRTAQADLERSRAELRLLIAAQDRIQEEERKRIARELHDDLQQTLAVIRMDASEIGERLSVDPASIATLVSEVERLAMEAIVSTRRIVNDLRPEMLEDLGLVAALTTMANQFVERTGTPCRFSALEDVGVAMRDEQTLTTCLYRVTQEALNNVVKHAHASAVQVSLAQVGPGLIRLCISDDGIGMKQSTTRGPESFGLLGMAERVRVIGGHLRIDSPPDGGTNIEVLAPVQGASAAAPTPTRDLPEALLRELSSSSTDVEAATRSRRADLDRSLQSLIDALDGNVAVLDKSGTIRVVNRAWCEFSERNGHVRERQRWPGKQYLDVCRASAEKDPSVRCVVHGLSDVLEGRRDHFTCEYPCDMPDGRNWFRMNVASAIADLVIVHHVNLGDRIGPAVTLHAEGAPAEEAINILLAL